MNLQGSRAATTRGRGLTSTPEPPAIFAASRSACGALHVCFAENITIHHLLKTLNPSLKYSADFPSNKNHGIPCTTFLQPHFLHIRTQDFEIPIHPLSFSTAFLFSFFASKYFQMLSSKQTIVFTCGSD